VAVATGSEHGLFSNGERVEAVGGCEQSTSPKPFNPFGL
jgi:hypothetical protein